MIVFIVVSKLDANTAREWEQSKVENDSPSLKVLNTFLKTKADLLETLETKFMENKSVKSTSNTKSFYVNNSNCVVCKKEHYVSNCPDILKLTSQERQARIKELRLCLNCLKVGHFSKTCRSRPCKICNFKHHSLLHVNKENDSKNVEKDTHMDNSDNTVTLNSCSSNNTIVLLSTALVHIRDKNNKVWTARALLDSGSQSSFISESLCTRLKLDKSEIKLAVTALNNINLKIKYKCETKIESMRNAFNCTLKFLVVPDIAGHLPNMTVNVDNLNIPRNLLLADPSFYEPGTIDILLGADIFWSLISSGQKCLGIDKPVLQNSQLGWLVSGPIAENNSGTIRCNFINKSDLQENLIRFWELEEISVKNNFSEDEQKCEQHYVKNTKRDKTGRFVVSLPLRDTLDKLGDSYEQAIRRFMSLEKRLQNNPTFKDMYSKFMNEYEQLGHMSLVKSSDNAKHVYYMPHHGVLRQDSSTTKLRVVFDASAPTSSGYSLNNLQLNSPTIQNDLLSILIRFRKYSIVVAADIEKMYRQVLVNENERSLQRIVWRDDSTKPINNYNLNTVTYGTTAAPFLAIRTLVQLANENEKQYPVATEIIKNDFYVDDMLTGFDSIEEADMICQDVINILQGGGFNLRKFYSNKSDLLKNVQVSNTENMFVKFASNENAKTLGIIWCPHDDKLKYSLSKNLNVRRTVTKRSILSVISQIFDPLGLIGPCIIIVKILLQKLWLEKLSWDDSIPNNLLMEWLKFDEELPCLNDLTIKRQIIGEQPVHIEIHGFADASLQAYGACIYLKTVSESNKIETHLLCAKSKVAPLKTLTIPKLELCAALMLSRLLQKVTESLNLTVNEINLWSDSTIVLSWLKKQPNLLKTFVSNRVAEIQELTADVQWRHIASNDNPADLISRGVYPSDISNLNLWWFGPTWLNKSKNEWPNFTSDIVEEVPEMRKPIQNFIVSNKNIFLYEDFSKLLHFQRIVAYIFRFKFNCQNKQTKKTGPLTVTELNEALLKTIKLAQERSFAYEIHCLKTNKSLKTKGRLSNLNPFVDSDGLLRVGGRLNNSCFNFEKKHPIILDNKDHLTNLIFENEHERLFHAGPQLLLANIRDKFWPLQGRTVAKKTVHNCVRCFRFSPKLTKPLMGDLPRERLESSFPFNVTGIDYAGPFVIKDRKGRGCKTSKCFVCIFVCFSVKAIHIELVSDLTRDAFISALRRFVARRGKPIKIFSDNATNFVSANKELIELAKILNSNNQDLQQSLANEGIKWEFIPPHSPHFGGLWEAGVKTIKYHMRRVMGAKLFTFEEFYTLLVQIESIINSRPLSPLTNDPQDLTPLTPAHFLVGRLLTAVPDQDYTDIPENRLTSSYHHIQKMRQHFWQRWSKEYVSELQVRVKWQQHQSDLKEDSLVLVKDDGLPPLRWRLGRIISTCPGRDGINRVATIRTQDGITKRSFSRLCPLPIPSTTTD